MVWGAVSRYETFKIIFVRLLSLLAPEVKGSSGKYRMMRTDEDLYLLPLQLCNPNTIRCCLYIISDLKHWRKSVTISFSSKIVPLPIQQRLSRIDLERKK